MQWNQGIFAVKLYELEEEYGRLQSKLHVFQEKDEKQAEEALVREITDQFSAAIRLDRLEERYFPLPG